jgi:hypothetical protein
MFQRISLLPRLPSIAHPRKELTVKVLRSFTAAVALAALSVVPAAAQAHTPNQDRHLQPVSRSTDQTPAQRTLTRTLAKEHDAYLTPTDPETQAAQRALTRTLAKEHDAYPAPTDGQAANEQQAAVSGTFPLLPVLAVIGLTVLLAMAAIWRRQRVHSRPREAT